MTPQDFIAKWGAPGGVPGPAYALNEEQGAQSHFLDLCELLGVPKPGSREDYRFEERGAVIGGKTGYADVFMRGVFAWENKAPGKNLDAALKQLLTYSLALSNPPILVVSDRLSIRIHTQFTGHPSTTHQVHIDAMDQPDKLALLRRIWTEPESFKPRQTNRDITEAAAQSFAALADGLRQRAGGDGAHRVAHFLTQCVFCFFAEDVGLLPGRMFERLLNNQQITPERLTQGLTQFLGTMQTGGLYGVDDIPWFNGGLFQTIAVPPLSAPDLAELRRAANLDWSAIDVSIFGTLFERGLDPTKRSQLGAHYTDPATIERLIDPVIRRPLLQKWEQTNQQLRGLTAKITRKGDKNYRAAHALFITWLDGLKNYRALDPACGSGNFLYLALKCLKDVEHHSHLHAAELGLDREADLVTGPHNVLGLELNDYAAELARVTVWIGELQWRLAHGYPFKTHPVLEALEHIECRDALLAEGGGEAAWPAADVVVGNPPFLGGSKKRGELGDGYFDALNRVYDRHVPGGADLVCYWFHKARQHITQGQLQRAGLVTTQAIRAGSNRKVLDAICSDSRIFDAWSDEPWVNDGAAVRVSLVCFGIDSHQPNLNGQQVALIHADLKSGDQNKADLTTATILASNANTVFLGTKKSGGFDIPGSIVRTWLALPNPHCKSNAEVLSPWANGQELVGRPQDKWIIDFGTHMLEDDACCFEAPFTFIVSHIKPEREKNNRAIRAKFWWRLAETMPAMRRAIAPLHRFLASPRVSKHRVFVWLAASFIADDRLAIIARADDTTFGILSSRIHELWSLAQASMHGVGNDPTYNAKSCFETFPFPEGLTPRDTAHQQTERLEGGALIPAGISEPNIDQVRMDRSLLAIKTVAIDIAQAAKRLNDLRQAWLNPPEWTQVLPEVVPLGLARSPYPDRILARAGFEKPLAERTLTKLYNQRPAWLVSAHQALDAAVARAYGWADYTPAMPDDDILRRLLALNLARSTAPDPRGQAAPGGCCTHVF